MIVKRLLLVLGAATVALVTACGGSPGWSHSSQGHPAGNSSPSSAQSSSSSGGGNSSSGIPQNGGGDHDSDNSGGPSDGDGNI